MPDKRAHHPDGKHTIEFGERWHTYTDNTGKRYTSGTKFVGKFFPKFDMVGMSVKCSKGKNPKYAGRDPEEIRAEWSAEGDRGRTEGTLVHEYAEALMCDWPMKDIPVPISERTEAMFPHTQAVVRELRRKYQFIAAEIIIFSPEMGLAGQADLIMYDPKTNEIIIGDYKQNKKLSAGNTWQMGLQPIDHLGDSDMEHYCLQLSLYQFIMEKESYFPGISGFRREIIHINPKGYKIIPLKEYFYYEICEMYKAWR